MESESGVTRSITDELHFQYIEGDQMEGRSSVTQSIIEEFYSWYMQ